MVVKLHPSCYVGSVHLFSQPKDVPKHTSLLAIHCSDFSSTSSFTNSSSLGQENQSQLVKANCCSIRALFRLGTRRNFPQSKGEYNDAIVTLFLSRPGPRWKFAMHQSDKFKSILFDVTQFVIRLGQFVVVECTRFESFFLSHPYPKHLRGPVIDLGGSTSAAVPQWAARQPILEAKALHPGLIHVVWHGFTQRCSESPITCNYFSTGLAFVGIDRACIGCCRLGWGGGPVGLLHIFFVSSLLIIGRQDS
jgi:hypothetical protein